MEKKVTKEKIKILNGHPNSLRSNKDSLFEINIGFALGYFLFLVYFFYL